MRESDLSEDATLALTSVNNNEIVKTPSQFRRILEHLYENKPGGTSYRQPTRCSIVSRYDIKGRGHVISINNPQRPLGNDAVKVTARAAS